MCKIDYRWNPSICICESSKYFKVIVDDSVIVGNKKISVTNSVLNNKTNIISTNVTGTHSVNKF